MSGRIFRFVNAEGREGTTFLIFKKSFENLILLALGHPKVCFKGCYCLAIVLHRR